MANEQEYHSEILAYLSGKMAEADRSAFEARFQVEPALKLALQEELQLRYALQQEVRKQQRQRFAQAAIEAQQTQRTVPWTYWAVAAAITLLVASILIRFISAPMSSDELYAQYFSQDSNIPLMRSDQADQSDWGLAKKYLQNQQFDRAIDPLETLLADSTFQYPQQARLYLGISYLHQNEAEKALEHFRTISPDQRILYIESGWYSAMAGLKLGDKDLVQLELGRFLELSNNTERRSKAEKILDELGSE